MVRKHAKEIKLYIFWWYRLAEELLVKETMDVRSIQKIIGDRPFPVNKTFQAYLETEPEVSGWYDVMHTALFYIIRNIRIIIINNECCW